MKKFLALLLVLVMALGLVACSVEQANNGGSNTTNNTQNDTTNNTTDDTTGDTTGEAVEISLWTYPIGDWGKPEVVSEIIAKFNEKYPNITVTHQLLDYSNGDAQVNTAMEGGTVGDIIMEGPERLVSNWGANGKMVDLSDMWTDEMKADMASASIEKACQWTDGAYYEYPLCMTTHCMAINYEAFEAAGALQYIDEETRTWTTDDFVKACEALREVGDGNFQFLGRYGLLRTDDADLFLYAVTHYLHGVEDGVVLLHHYVDDFLPCDRNVLRFIAHIAEFQHFVGINVEQVFTVDVGGRTDARAGFDADRDADERIVVLVLDDTRDARDLPRCTCGRSRGAPDDDLPSREFPGVDGSGEQLFQHCRNGLVRDFQGDFAVDVQDVVVVDEDVVALAFDLCEYLLDGAVLYVERDGFRRLCRLCTDGPDEPDCCQQKQECYPE